MTTDLNMAMKGFSAQRSFTNPWEGQGTNIGDDGPSSTPGGGGGWWDNWGRDVLNSIPDYLDSLGGLFNGGRQNQDSPYQRPPAGAPDEGSNMLVIGGVVFVVILLIIILLKK